MESDDENDPYNNEFSEEEVSDGAFLPDPSLDVRTMEDEPNNDSTSLEEETARKTVNRESPCKEEGQLPDRSKSVMVVSGANFKYQTGPSNEFVTGNLDSDAKSSNTTSQFASSFTSQSDWSGVQEEGNLLFNVKMFPDSIPPQTGVLVKNKNRTFNRTSGFDPRMCPVCKIRNFAMTQLSCKHQVCRECAAVREGDPCQICQTPVESILPVDSF